MSLRRIGTRAWLACVVIACCFGLSVLGADSALAETTTFKYTGKEQEFKVPTGVTSVEVEAVGSEGSASGSVAGGAGAIVTGNIPVTAGHTLYVEVGGKQLASQACEDLLECVPGFNGGGISRYGNGGGGASDVRTVSIKAEPSPGGEASLNSRLLVAGGGGGGGAAFPGLTIPEEGINAPPCAGGPGGAAGQKGSNGGSCGFTGSEGGGAGQASEGGTGGKGYAGTEALAEWNGGAGGLGVGGDGALDAGAGGGGGLYGGGGGGLQGVVGFHESAGEGGGGGGSNLVPSSGSHSLAAPGQEASVKFTYTVPPPTCTTAVGEGAYKTEHETGRLHVVNNLSTDLESPQTLKVKYETGLVQFRLLKLESATCTGGPGERDFHGEGTAVKGTTKGYTVSFSIYEQGEGNFFFQFELMKGAEVVNASGGPLVLYKRPTTEKIS